MVFCPEHPKREQTLKFTPLSVTTSIHPPFIYGSPSPPGVTLVDVVLKKQNHALIKVHNFVKTTFDKVLFSLIWSYLAIEC